MTTGMLTAAGPFLIDTSFSELTLVEDKSRTGKFILRGLFGRVGVPTNNGRLYTESVMRSNLERLAEDIAERGVFGELDHPADGRTKLTRVSHVITDLVINKNGEIIGEAEILDTPAGKVLKALVGAGTRVGVSSRGIGTTTPGRDGQKVVNEDYRLMTFDVVAEPANRGAHPGFFVEGEEATPASITREQLRAAFPDQIREFECEAAAFAGQQTLSESVTTDLSREQIEHELRQEFEAKLVGELSSLKAQFESQSARGDASSEDVHARYLSVSEANKALQSENEAYEEKVERIESLAKNLGYKFRLEQRLIGVEPEIRESVREAVGDPAEYESLDELDEAIDEVSEGLQAELEEAQAETAALEQAKRNMREELAEEAEPVVKAIKKSRRALARKEQSLQEEEQNLSRRAKRKSSTLTEQEEALHLLQERLENEIGRRQESEKRMRASFNHHLEDLTEEVSRVRQERDFYVAKSERQRELTEDLGASAYAERRLAKRADAPRLRKLLKRVRPQSRDEVDELLEDVEEPIHSRGSEYEKVRRHVRRRRPGRDLNEDVDVNGGGGQKILRHANLSMDQSMLRLAGVPGTENPDY